jgi:hypothetical protein
MHSIQVQYQNKTTTKITLKSHSVHISFIIHQKVIHNVGT